MAHQHDPEPGTAPAEAPAPTETDRSRSPNPQATVTEGRSDGSGREHGGLEDAALMSPAEERRMDRRIAAKFDATVIPLATMLYLLSFLDRTNIGQARLDGLQKELNLSSHDYRVALTILYVPYIVGEVPANLVLKKVGANFWLPFLVTCWGVCATLQGIVTSRTGLYIVRFFLGLTEGGILPGISVWLTFFYKRHELQLRQGLFFSAASLSGAFSGLLAAAINNLDGRAGLHGWSWIFILEGIFTVLFGVCSFFLAPRSPGTAKFLTAEERAFAVRRLEMDWARAKAEDLGQGTSGKDGFGVQPADVKAGEKVEEKQESVVPAAADEHSGDRFEWRYVLDAYKSPIVWLLCFQGYCDATSVYSAAFFLPTIVKGLGTYTATHAQLLTVPPFAAAFVVTIVTAIYADRFKQRATAALFCFALSIIGFSMAYASSNSHVQYGATFLLVSGAFAWPACGLAWMANNTAGHYKRATAIASLIIFTNCGGITSTWIYQDSDAPRYRKGHEVNLALNVVGFALTLVLEAYLWHENKARRDGKRNGKVKALKEQGLNEEEVHARLGDRHPAFVYTL